MKIFTNQEATADEILSAIQKNLIDGAARDLLKERAQAHFLRADLYLSQHLYHSAVADLQQTIALFPKIAMAHGELGWTLILQGKFDEARRPCEMAHDLDRSDFNYAITLGHTYLLQGDAAQARKYYEEAVPSIENEEILRAGPISDFELFISKGWQVEAGRRELEWIKAAYETKKTALARARELARALRAKNPATSAKHYQKQRSFEGVHVLRNSG